MNHILDDLSLLKKLENGEALKLSDNVDILSEVTSVVHTSMEWETGKVYLKMETD